MIRLKGSIRGKEQLDLKHTNQDWMVPRNMRQNRQGGPRARSIDCH